MAPVNCVPALGLQPQHPLLLGGPCVRAPTMCLVVCQVFESITPSLHSPVPSFQSVPLSNGVMEYLFLSPSLDCDSSWAEWNSDQSLARGRFSVNVHPSDKPIKRQWLAAITVLGAERLGSRRTCWGWEGSPLPRHSTGWCDANSSKHPKADCEHLP